MPPLTGLALSAASYLKVDELHEHSGVPFDFSGDYVRTYQRKFLVEMDHPKWGVLEACIAPGLPSVFSPFINPYTGFFDGNALMVKLSGERRKERTPIWVITCDYSTKIPRMGIPSNFGYPVDQHNKKSGGPENYPELEPPEVDFEFEEVNVPARSDLDGKAFVNSAYEPYNPAPTLPYQRSIYVLSRNEARFNVNIATAYAGSVNKSQFAGYPPDSVLCLAPRVKMANRGGVLYWRVTYRFKFGFEREGGEYESFQHEELDQGYQQRFQVLDGVGNPVLDGAGNPVWSFVPIRNRGALITRPKLLDGNGKIQTRQIVTGVDANGDKVFGPEPVFNKYRTRRRLNFDLLFRKGLTGLPGKKGGGFPPGMF